MCRPGKFIRAYLLEPLKDSSIGFGHENYVPTRRDAGHQKLYKLAVLFTRDGYAHCLRFTSKGKNGYKSLSRDEQLNHLPVFAGGSSEKVPHGAPYALYTKDKKQYPGSMLCFDICRVKLTHTIYEADGEWTDRSAVDVYHFLMRNAYVADGMRDYLWDGFNISENITESFHGYRSPAARRGEGEYRPRESAQKAEDMMANTPQRLSTHLGDDQVGGVRVHHRGTNSIRNALSDNSKVDTVPEKGGRVPRLVSGFNEVSDSAAQRSLQPYKQARNRDFAPPR
ncbi:uncharacterized protein RCC_07535 [Ramularia collo-cygni]|uniref:Uncharacterized protein n=1 Tax=Ramularia collo-cygni TaxID=112498 RepID=A0A2D3V8A4_9PEZI|nr:uncharacterized protein RCC_07535 [Ramularia collo-cygni]CZT21670.1 uncharacterized protein RCC_07535 [Ramularia collo-cygni]